MPQNNLGTAYGKGPSAALAPLSLGKQSDLLVSSFHGAKYHQAYTGALFIAANSAAVTTSAGLATTYVGLCLSNPASSGKNLIMRRVNGALLVVAAAETAFNLITGYAAGGITAHTTPLTPTSGIIGTAGSPVGLADSACTLVGTPAWTRPLAATQIAAGGAWFDTDLEGGMILPPGAYCAIGTNIASPASGFWGGVEWEEAPQ